MVSSTLPLLVLSVPWYPLLQQIYDDILVALKADNCVVAPSSTMHALGNDTHVYFLSNSKYLFFLI